MKKSTFIRGMATLAACALLLPTITSAQTTPFTATGWINGPPLPGTPSSGTVWTNALGQVLWRGMAHTARVQATDARVTGQVLIIADGAFNADGTATMQGPCYLQVGTWDAAGTNFTPGAGVWEMNWRGVMQTNYSASVSIAGYGSGGTIDGSRLEMTMTRAAAAGPFDPTVPYLYTGTIKPAPLNTTEVADDFNHPFTSFVSGTGTCSNSNGQFRAAGQFPATRGTFDYSHLLGQVGPSTIGSVANGTTLEWRADLVSLGDNATNMAQLAVTAYPAPGYGFHQGRDFAYLMKWSSKDNYYRVLWCERTPGPLPHTNIVLALALTRVDSSLAITARVLEKANPNNVLFSHSYLDTPASDPSLTSAQFYALTGMQMSALVPDAAEAPPTAVWTLLGLFQYTDGHQPAATAVFANFEVRTSEIPPVGVERAVRLSWPASAAINYAVQSAPTAQGPWQLVPDQTIPGFQTMALPANSSAQFFRLIQAP